MVDQATQVDPSERTGSAGRCYREAGVSTLAREVWTLAQLQVQMVAAELRQTLRKVIRPLLLLAAGTALLLGCVPVLVLALAALFQQAGLLASAAHLLAALVGMAVAGVLAGAGYYGLRNTLGGLTRSREELAENLASLRAAFSRHDDTTNR